MGKRREGREAAVQFLFCSDINPELTPAEIDSFFDSIRPASAKVREFAKTLASGVCEHRQEIDSVIEKHTDNYRLERVSAVDRSILRLAVYEIVYREDIPSPVSINEAIEVAKRFGTEESGRFVNGILDHLNREIAGRRRDSPDAPGEQPETTGN